MSMLILVVSCVHVCVCGGGGVVGWVVWVWVGVLCLASQM